MSPSRRTHTHTPPQRSTIGTNLHRPRRDKSHIPSPSVYTRLSVYWIDFIFVYMFRSSQQYRINRVVGERNLNNITELGWLDSYRPYVDHTPRSYFQNRALLVLHFPMHSPLQSPSLLHTLACDSLHCHDYFISKTINNETHIMTFTFD